MPDQPITSASDEKPKNGPMPLWKFLLPLIIGWGSIAYYAYNAWKRGEPTGGEAAFLVVMVPSWLILTYAGIRIRWDSRPKKPDPPNG